MKKNKVLILVIMWMELKKYDAKRKKSDTKGHTFQDSIYPMCPEQANP